MSAQTDRVTSKLFVAKLPDTTRKLDLQKLFEKYGEVIECDIVRKYAFVHYATHEEAADAVKNLNNTFFQGSKITVQFSDSPVRRKPGMGQSSACYRCGKYGHWSRNCPLAAPSSGQMDVAFQSNVADPSAYNSYQYFPYGQDPHAQSSLIPSLVERPRGTRYVPYVRHKTQPSLSPSSFGVPDVYRIDPYMRPPPEYYHVSSTLSMQPCGPLP